MKRINTQPGNWYVANNKNYMKVVDQGETYLIRTYNLNEKNELNKETYKLDKDEITIIKKDDEWKVDLINFFAEPANTGKPVTDFEIIADEEYELGVDAIPIESFELLCDWSEYHVSTQIQDFITEKEAEEIEKNA